MSGGGFVRTHADAEIPDLQFHFTATAASDEPLDNINYEPKGRGCCVLPTLLYPKSTGDVSIISPNPAVAPRIEPNYLTHEEDIETLMQNGTSTGPAAVRNELEAPNRLGRIRTSATMSFGVVIGRPFITRRNLQDGRR